MASILEVNNETTASRSRTTKDGRKITYRMNVVQQPERARACGQGAKSSTDRRPVDPPPIIDLRVFEGEGTSETDITFSYRANFFVWASLEHARPMAHGRVPPGSSNIPVLCGTPVAGISYLDRPHPAGYFIFPDLSVRHEGKYRISFTLYEDQKDPAYEDAEPQPCSVESPVGEYINGRCEVKSAPFVVFSAKKFPGLAESTDLSRLVADQGCRVRIRRDVRMRKRETAGAKDWDDYEDATAEQRSRQASTPHLDHSKYVGSAVHSRAPSGEPVLRPRSNSIVSNASVHQPVHQPVAEWAPPDPGPTYQQLSQSPHVMTSQGPPQYYHAPTASHDQTAMPTYAPPPPYMPQHSMPPQQPQQMHNPHMSPYHLNTAPLPSWGYGPPPPAPPPQQMQHHQQQPQMQSPAYGPPTNHMRHNSMPYGPPPPEYGPQFGAPHYGPQSQPSTPMAPVDGHAFGRPLHQIYPNGSQMPSENQIHAPYTTSLPPLRAQASNGNLDRPVPYAPQPPPPQYVSHMPSGASAQKRNFGSVFSTQHIDQPLRSGARPDATGTTQVSVGLDGHSDHSSSDDESMELERLKMEYRRADGTRVQRRWPQMYS